MNNRDAATISVLQQMLDSINYRWVQSVVLFDFYSQIKILNNTRETVRSLRSGKLNFTPVLWVGGFLIGVILIVLFLRKQKLSAEERILLLFRERVRKRYGPEAVSYNFV